MNNKIMNKILDAISEILDKEYRQINRKKRVIMGKIRKLQLVCDNPNRTTTSEELKKKKQEIKKEFEESKAHASSVYETARALFNAIENI